MCTAEPEDSISSNNYEGIGPYDVLCGRHKLAFHNIGNKRLRVTVSTYMGRFTAAASRKEKSAIIASVLSLIESCGGRFLKWSSKEQEFVQIDRKKAYEKCGHLFRDMALAKSRSTTAGESTLKKHRNKQGRAGSITSEGSEQSDIILPYNSDEGGDDASSGVDEGSHSTRSNPSLATKQPARDVGPPTTTSSFEPISNFKQEIALEDWEDFASDWLGFDDAQDESSRTITNDQGGGVPPTGNFPGGSPNEFSL